MAVWSTQPIHLVTYLPHLSLAPRTHHKTPHPGVVPGSDEAAALALDPLKGNVAFSASEYGWSFTVDSFAGEGGGWAAGSLQLVAVGWLQFAVG